MLSELTEQPIAADSVIGVRPTRRAPALYEYDISLDLVEGAFFLGGGVGKNRQTGEAHGVVEGPSSCECGSRAQEAP
jgi:hypothetical protein